MRNYKKELAWKREKYDEIRANIDRELGLKLREKLKIKNMSIAEWIRKCAEEFIKKD